MDASTLSTSDWLKKTDVDGKQVVTTIDNWELGESPDGKPELQLTLGGKNGTKKWSLNATNRESLIAMYGPETDSWIGKSVTLYLDPTVRNPTGATVGGIRIKYDADANTATDTATNTETPF